MKKFTIGLAFAVSCFFIVSGKANANLLTNGSFEDPQVNFSWDRLNNGSTAITGWTVIGSDIDWIGSYWQAAEGNKSIDLDGQFLGGIEQTFDTIANQDYSVTFAMSGNPDGGFGNKTLSVSAGTISNLPFTYSVGASNSYTTMDYILKTFSFTATSNSTTLSFRSISPTNYGAVIDNVIVQRSENPVPEPASMLLFGTGILGLVGYARRRKNV